MLSVKGVQLTKIYRSKHKITPILLGQDFTITKGSIVFLTGKSGAGKSTLLKLILREELPDYGQLFLNDLEITRLPAKHLKRIRSKIGVVFQHYRLISYKTVAENISFILDINGIPRKQQPPIINELLQKVRLSDKADFLPQQLSGGEQRRVTIARALATNPAIILADEPTGDLDPFNTEKVIEIFQNLLQEGRTIILATHHLDIINEFESPVLWYMERGHIYQNITLSELKTRYFADTIEFPRDASQFMKTLPEDIQIKLAPIMPVRLQNLAKLTPKILQIKLGLNKKEVEILIQELTAYLN